MTVRPSPPGSIRMSPSGKVRVESAIAGTFRGVAQSCRGLELYGEQSGVFEQGEVAGGECRGDAVGVVAGGEQGGRGGGERLHGERAFLFALAQRGDVGGVVPERAPLGTLTSLASAAQAERQFGRMVRSAKRRMACA